MNRWPPISGKPPDPCHGVLFCLAAECSLIYQVIFAAAAMILNKMSSLKCGGRENFSPAYQPPKKSTPNHNSLAFV